MPEHEAHLFVACPTCRFVIRPADAERARQPCPECGWTLMEIGYALWDTGCAVNVEWSEDRNSPPLDLPDVQHALALVDELLERESEEGLLGEPPLPAEPERSRLRQLIDQRLARQEAEEDDAS